MNGHLHSLYLPKYYWVIKCEDSLSLCAYKHLGDVAIEICIDYSATRHVLPKYCCVCIFGFVCRTFIIIASLWYAHRTLPYSISMNSWKFVIRSIQYYQLNLCSQTHLNVKFDPDVTSFSCMGSLLACCCERRVVCATIVLLLCQRF